MTTSKIDELRELVAVVGRRQTEYWRFFPDFAVQIESELGEYLGDKASVALSSATGDFSFDHGSYRAEGLGFEKGKFRIPLMFRLKNLHDEGDLLIRIRLFFVMGEKALLAWIEKDDPITFVSTDLKPLLDGIYEHLVEALSSSAWFDENPGNYQQTRIGFQRA